jgi:endo-1,4-beta-xylanase
MSIIKISKCGFFYILLSFVCFAADSGKKPLRELFAVHHKYAGCSYDDVFASPEDISNQLRIAKEEFYVIENGWFYFTICHPKRDSFNFERTDRIASFVKANKLQMRGHVLFWHTYYPNWLDDSSNGLTLKHNIVNHLKVVMGRYRDQISSWNVVNEALDKDGSLLKSTFNKGIKRPNMYYQRIGPYYIDSLFLWTKMNNVNAKLIYNDYGIEQINQKSDSLYNLVLRLKKNNIPIDGIGMQCHFDLQKMPSFESISSNISRLEALGLTIDFTETDIRVKKPITSEKLKAQAKAYQELVKVFLAHKSTRLISFYGISDNCSWIPRYFPDYSAACLFDSIYKQKPSYDSIISTLKAWGRTPPAIKSKKDVNGVRYYVLQNSMYASGFRIKAESAGRILCDTIFFSDHGFVKPIKMKKCIVSVWPVYQNSDTMSVACHDTIF